MANSLEVGDAVVIPWSIAEIRGTVAEVYGPANDRRVVVALTPEMSGFVVDEPTTVAFPIHLVRPAVAA